MCNVTECNINARCELTLTHYLKHIINTAFTIITNIDEIYTISSDINNIVLCTGQIMHKYTTMCTIAYIHK